MTNFADDADGPAGGIAPSLRRLFAAQVMVGRAVTEVLAIGAGATLKALPKRKSCCEIPEPCWMPKPLGEIHCNLAAGVAGVVHIRVTNEDNRGRNFTLDAAGHDASLVNFSPASFNLGPKERALVTATFVMPAQGPTEFDFVVWLRGCSDYYLRWVVCRSSRCGACCHEVCVQDKPDYFDNWYDHFYCQKPCHGVQREPLPGTVGRPK